MTVDFNKQQTQRPDDYFILQAKSKLKEGQGWYYVRGCRNSANEMMDYIAPTKVSIDIGLLEWVIPNTQFNQALISQAYNDFKILKQGEETLMNADVKIMPGMPMPKDVVKETPKVPRDVPHRGAVVNGVIGETLDTYPPADNIPEGPGEAPNTPIIKGTTFKNTTLDGINSPPIMTDYFANPANPMKKKQLKSKITEKLTELRVKIPEGATLKNLQNMLKISSGGEKA